MTALPELERDAAIRVHVPLSTDAPRTAERTMVEEYLAGTSAARASPHPFDRHRLCLISLVLPSLLLPSSSCQPRLCMVQTVLLPQTFQDRLVSGEITVHRATYFVTPTRCAVGQVPLLVRFRRALYTRYPTLRQHVPPLSSAQLTSSPLPASNRFAQCKLRGLRGYCLASASWQGAHLH